MALDLDKDYPFLGRLQAVRVVLPVLILLLGSLAGCTQDPEPVRPVTPADVGYDPSTIHVSGIRKVNATIPSWDGATEASALIYSPLSNDTLADGAVPRWPVVLFLHGWGGNKESYIGRSRGVPGSEAGADATGGVDRLSEFAQAGFIAVAYDARGFGESGGYADVAGPSSQADLTTVLDWVEARYPTNGKVGVLGQSYGGGQAYLAWAKEPRITTAVPMYGWVDLADSLIPENVPKLEWAQFLYLYGLGGAHGRYDPMIHEWYTQLYTRTDLATVRAQMGERSALTQMPSVQKPLFLCQGLQESLFPQADRAWQAAGGFTRALVYTGGHGTGDPTCWKRSLDWFQFFLAGHDTRVDAWPLLETVDASNAEGRIPYSQVPATVATSFHLRAPDLVAASAPSTTFSIRQSPTTPTGDPAALSDILGVPRQSIPDQLRSDPTAVTFTTTAFDSGALLVGASTLRLQVQSGAPPFQVAGVLLRVAPDGSSQVLGHAAFAALAATDLTQGSAELRFEWTHARLHPGDRIQLRLAGNDPSWWMPLLADYEVTFDGTSALTLPLAD